MGRNAGNKLRIFLDSSVVLAACMSGTGASHQVFRLAGFQNWVLLVSPWVLREVRFNLANKQQQSILTWATLSRLLEIEDDELTFDWPVTFEKSKDKPVLFSALACADVLLTLDRRDFGELLGKHLYGMRVLTPGEFLRIERETGNLRPTPGL